MSNLLQCQTYHNIKQIILHDPLGFCGSTYDIEPHTLKSSNQQFLYETKISKYNKLLQIHQHNCTVKIYIGGYVYEVTNLN